MTPGAVALLSVSMSTDAFAAAVGRGASKRPSWPAALKTGAVFGMIEAMTPIAGWGLGALAAGFVQQVDHWIAFGLLLIVGSKMIFDAIRRDENERAERSGALALVVTAVGTSLDAAAVGVGLAFIGANIWAIAASIGFTTFLFTTTGMMIGGIVGARFGRWAELAGGLMLIGIGSAILIEHLGLLA